MYYSYAIIIIIISRATVTVSRKILLQNSLSLATFFGSSKSFDLPSDQNHLTLGLLIALYPSSLKPAILLGIYY